jgi:hypothetical protein
MKNDINKFSIAQMTSNDSGKTSGSGTMGILICTIGCLSFLLGVLDKIFFTNDIDIMSQTIIFTGIGASLLAVRKVKDADKTTVVENTEESDDQLNS